MVNKETNKNKKRVVIPRNLFLPQVSIKRHLHYRTQTIRKKTHNALKYVDYSINTPSDIKDIVELMETRPRFQGLVKYVQKILLIQGQVEYRTRYVINAQTINDCRLAILYINHYLSFIEI